MYVFVQAAEEESGDSEEEENEDVEEEKDEEGDEEIDEEVVEKETELMTEEEKEEVRREKITETTNEFAEKLGDLLRQRVDANAKKVSEGLAAIEQPKPKMVLNTITNVGEMNFLFNVDLVVPEPLQDITLKTYTLGP